MQLLRGRGVEVRALGASADSRYLAATGGRLVHVWDLLRPGVRPRLLKAPGATGGDAVDFLGPAGLAVRFPARLRTFDLARPPTEPGAMFRLRGAILDPPRGLLKRVEPAAPPGEIVTYRLTPRGQGKRTARAPVGGNPGLIGFSPGGEFTLGIAETGVGSRNYQVRDAATDAVCGAVETPVELFDSEPSAWPLFVERWSFSPDGRRLFALARDRLLAYDWPAGPAPALDLGLRGVRDFAAHPAGRLVATIEGSRTVRLRDAGTLATVRAYDFGLPNLRRVLFTPDGTRCILGNGYGKVLAFDVDD